MKSDARNLSPGEMFSAPSSTHQQVLAQLASQGDEEALSTLRMLEAVRLAKMTSSSISGKPAPSEPKEKESVGKRIDTVKVIVKAIDLSTPEGSENLQYTFSSTCRALGIPRSGLNAFEEEALALLVDKWTTSNSTITSSLRRTFGDGGTGSARLNHVKSIFMAPLIAKRDLDPEAEIQKFSYVEILKSDGQNVHKVLLGLRELIERLPHVVQAKPAYWIERVEKKAGHTVLFYMERVLKDDKVGLYANMKTDWIQFSNALAAAIDMRAVFEGPPSGFNAHEFVPKGGGRPDASEQQSCKKCNGRYCPHIDGRSQCDVHNNVSQARAREIMNIPFYKGWLDRTRAKLEKSPINYPQPTQAQKEAIEKYEASRQAKGKGKGRGGSLVSPLY